MREALDSSSRFVRRQWQRRLGTLRPTLLWVVILGAAAFAGWVVFFSSWLAAAEVEVAGTRTVPAQDVIAAADVQVGTPLVRIDLTAVDRKVSAIPAVASVEVHRSWPHTVSVTVVERRPVATIRRAGEWWVFDAEGVLYRKSGVRPRSLSVVRFQGKSEPAELREVAAVVTSLPAEIRAQMTRVRASSIDSITLVLRGGRQVVWGNAGESHRKVQVLSLLLQRPAAVYDVSVPEQPTTVARLRR